MVSVEDCPVARSAGVTRARRSHRLKLMLILPMVRSFKLKQVDESRNLEHVLDIVVHVAQDNLVALSLSFLEHVEQDTQATRCNVLQLITFKCDILADSFGNGL